MVEKIVIVGAGQAGLQGAISVRQAGFAGELVVIGAEDAPPYQRPPLSKAYLKGELSVDRLLLRPANFYKQKDIDLRLGAAATAIDRDRKTVTLEDGSVVDYDRLMIATGAPPRRLSCPGADLEGVHYLRTLKDSDALRPLLSVEGRVVIVGAGYIGLEVAAVARAAGREVTVLEMADRVLARVAGPTISAFFEDVHRAEGVDLRLGARLESFEGGAGNAGGRVAAAVLADGERIPCAAVLVGVGAAPDEGLAAEAGLSVENGVVVDETARTEDPDIWAAGDVANFPSLLYGRRMRLESVPNAIDQAKVAGANMAGKHSVYAALPWFWSDQYDVKLQTAGCSVPEAREIVRGEPATRKFSVWYVKYDRLFAVDAVNDPAAFAIAKRLLSPAPGAPRRPAGVPVDVKILADPDADLKSLTS